MGQTGWRLPDDLLKRVRVHCAQAGERQNEFVRQALEKALTGGPSITIESSVLEAAASDAPKLLKFSPEEEAAHREAERRAIARQFVREPDRPRPIAKKKPAAQRLGKGYVPPRPKGK
jgi:plasmid stability protein